MLQVLIWSLFVGTLGIDGVLVAAWLRWQQKMAISQEKEEEEILSTYKFEDSLTGELPAEPMVGLPSPHSLKEESLQPLNGSSSSVLSQRTSRVSPQPFPQPKPLPNRKNAVPAKAQTKTQAKAQTKAQTKAPASNDLSNKPTISGNDEQNTRMQEPTNVNGFTLAETKEKPMYFADASSTEWEYKIVRAHYDLFRNAQEFIKLCEEEAQAGWILLEKLDDRRVRFKRSVAMREKVDVTQLAFDPYRCYYGRANYLAHVIGAIAAVTAMVLPAYLGYTLVSQALQETPKKSSQTQAPVELISPDFAPHQIP